MTTKYTQIEIAKGARGSSSFLVWGVPADGSPVKISSIGCWPTLDDALTDAKALGQDLGVPVVDATGAAAPAAGA